MAITDNLPTSRKDYEKDKNLKKNNNNLAESFTAITQILVKDSLKKLTNGDIAVNSIDDLKVVERMVQTSQEIFNHEQTTPALTSGAINIFVNKELGLPKDSKANATEVKKKVTNLNEQETNQLIKDLAQAQNNANADSI